MTEQEAEKVRCCSPSPYNTGLPQEQPDKTFICTCSGSFCSAWRWLPAHKGGGGFCGLAGKP